jgi:hypothetical protein
MSSSKRTADVIARRALREQQRHHRFGDDATCECCGDSTLIHLAKVATHLVCACCLALARGREILELHHLAGRGDGPTVRVCVNCHAELSELQRDWLEEPDAGTRLARGRQDLEALKGRGRRD